MTDRYSQVTLFSDDITAQVQNLIKLDKYMMFAVCCGGGMGLQQYIAAVPGSSSFLVGAAFPYAESETNRFLGYEPKSHVSRQIAIELAMGAYLRAQEHLVLKMRAENKAPTKEAIGLGITAALATTRVLKGGYRAHVAVMTKHKTFVATLPLEPAGVGPTPRKMHAASCDLISLDALFAAVGMGQIGPRFDLETVEEKELRDLFFAHPVFYPSGGRGVLKEHTRVVFVPGSFNPLHDGHRELVSALESRGLIPCYAVTADSVHKKSLTVQELLDRAAQVRADHWTGQTTPILFTHDDPLFIDKAKRYPGCAFAIGVDTLERMLDPQWYHDGERGVVNMLKELHSQCAGFYVMARKINGASQKLWDIKIPESCTSMICLMCHQLPGEGSDLSSTEIRKQLGIAD